MVSAATKSVDDVEAVEGAEQRGARRFTLLIRPAKIIAHHGEFICVVRDVSESGVSVRLFHPLPSSGDLALELQTGEQFEVERVWEKPGEAAFKFADDVSIEHFVTEVGAFPKRGLRLGIMFPVTLTVRGQKYEGLCENLSQQGARLTSEALFAIDQNLTLSGEGLSEVRAKVRWRGHGSYGVVFDDTFSLADFAKMAVTMQAPALLEQ